MQEIRTFCRVCEPACGLVAQVDDGRLVAVKPDRAHPISKGWACNKGIATLDIHRDPDRLAYPLKRSISGTFDRLSWDLAAAEIAGRLRDIRARHGDSSTAFYIGNPTAFNALIGVGLAPFIAGLGTRQIYGAGTQDCSNKFAGSELVYGSGTIHPIPDFDHANYILILGSNPSVSHMSFVSIADPINVLRQAAARGAKIRFVNPRRIESVKSGVGDLIQIRPDTDVFFLAALLHELDRIGGFDESVIARRGKNVAALRSFIAEYSPHRVAAVTGVPAEIIREAARDWAAADGATVTMSTGVNMGRHGTLAYWLVQALSFVTGNLDRRGGNIESVGYYPSAARSGSVDPARTFFEGRFGRMRHVRGALPGNLLADEILTSGEGQVRALFVVAGNPLLSMADELRLRRAFESLELLVCIDLYRNATGELAHYLLPSTDQFERADVTYAGLGLQHRPHVQYTGRVVEPVGGRKEEWWIFARLCRAMGFKGPLDEGDTPNVFARTDRMLQKGGVSWAQLQAQPGGIVLPPLSPGRFYDEQLATNDGKVDCCPPLLDDAIEHLRRTFVELETEPPGALRLITKRDRFMHNSWFHNVEKLKHDERARNYLFMHPNDAARLNLDDGHMVRVRSAAGSVELPLKHDADLMPGVVAATHGWGHAATPGMRLANERPGVNVNRLLSSGPGSYDPLSNMAFMTGVPVEVEAVET
ncbi:MAG: molybdopterin-dependent oxidoreductase [Deltaproteobacteria bacterium]|nr:molybdopterin-dependent oxidoreductase [Deltaproteobacteria bacterium]